MKKPEKKPNLNQFFPESSKVLLTGGGKDFVERIGVEAIKKAILSVMMGENVRTQTEPLSRRRIAQISGALIVMFARGCMEIDNFTKQLSSMAVHQLENTKRNDTINIWPAQWMIGLTGKSYQNVLKSNPEAFLGYVTSFEEAINESVTKCHKEFGDCRMSLGLIEDKNGKKA